jgi:hypothetical protein
MALHVSPTGQASKSRHYSERAKHLWGTDLRGGHGVFPPVRGGIQFRYIGFEAVSPDDWGTQSMITKGEMSRALGMEGGGPPD